MAADDVLADLRQAAQRRAEVDRETERARAAATDELVAAIRRAQAADVPLARIAREIGLSRQRIYKLLERE